MKGAAMARRGTTGRITVDAVVTSVVLVGLALVAVLPLVTPSPPDDMDGGSPTAAAVDHVERIATQPRPMGSPANAAAGAYIVEQLTMLGLAPETQTVMAPDYFGAPGGTVDVVNVLVRIAGTDSTGAVLVMGHYDSVPTSPGANDDAAAVGVMLEVARAVAEAGLRNDIILLFTDGEEPAPRQGSTAFFTEHPWAPDVGFVVNLEAAGGSGPSTVIEESGPEGWAVGLLAAGAPHPVAYSFMTATADLIGGIGTDFDVVADREIPGLHFAYLRGSPIYHTAADSIGNLGVESLAHHASNTMAVLSVVGDVDLVAAPHDDDGVFFMVGRSRVLRYPVALAIPAVVVAVALWAMGVGAGSRKRGVRIGSVMSGAAWMALSVVVALAAAAIWSLVAGLRPDQGVAESYGYLAVLLALVAALWLRMRVWLSRRRSGDDLLAALVAVWLVPAVLTSAWLPAMSYLFAWPATGGAIVLLVRSGGWTPSWGKPVAAILVGGPVLVLLVPPVETFFQLAMPRPGNLDSQMTAIIAVSMLLAFLAIALLDAAVRRRTSV